MKRLLFIFVTLPLGVLGLCVALGWWWLGQPLVFSKSVVAGVPVEFTVEPGHAARNVANSVVQAGVDVSPQILYAWFRISGQGTTIKAGVYEVKPGATPRSLLQQLVRGEQALRRLTLLEGWNFRETLAALRASKDLTQDLDSMDSAAVMSAIGLAGLHPEGQFFPDTYLVVKNATASSVLRLAAQAMQQRLDEVWAQKSTTSTLKSRNEALILASIIEKETGAESDRAMIGGVFNNRLRIGMRLQTDPTVIYGLGERFDGNLRRVHLLTDNPYNSYTRSGLPPTPISMPGWNSLLAAVQPAQTQALYFVARGDGSSQFSATLEEHNAAVRRYILKR